MEHFRTIYTAFCLEHYPDKTITDFERDVATLAPLVANAAANRTTQDTLIDTQLLGQAEGSTQHKTQSEKAEQEAEPTESPKGQEAEEKPTPTPAGGFDPLEGIKSKPMATRTGKSYEKTSKKSGWRKDNAAGLAAYRARNATPKENTAETEAELARAKNTPAIELPPANEDDRRKGRDLTALQAATLTHICQEKDRRPTEEVRHSHIAEIMGCVTQNVSGSVNGLVKKGFVEVQPSTEDKRARSIVPLRRACGKRYEPPQKIDGITRCEPARAIGYGIDCH